MSAATGTAGVGLRSRFGRRCPPACWPTATTDAACSRWATSSAPSACSPLPPACSLATSTSRSSTRLPRSSGAARGLVAERYGVRWPAAVSVGAITVVFGLLRFVTADVIDAATAAVTSASRAADAG